MQSALRLRSEQKDRSSMFVDSKLNYIIKNRKINTRRIVNHRGLEVRGFVCRCARERRDGLERERSTHRCCRRDFTNDDN